MAPSSSPAADPDSEPARGASAPTGPWLDRLAAGVAAAVGGLWAWRFAPGGDVAARARFCANALVPVATLCLLTLWVAPAHPALDRRVARAWRRIAAAVTSWWIAGVVWQLIGRPPFSIADAGQVAFFPLVVAGVFGFPAAPLGRGGRLRFSLDTAIVVVSGAAGVWYFAVWPAVAAGTANVDAIVNAVYPVADLALLVAACAALLRGTDAPSRRALAWAAGGLVMRFVGDLAYSWELLAGGHPDGGVADLTWLGACALLAVGACAQRRAALGPGRAPAAPADDTALPGHVSLLPYGAVVLLFAFLLATTRGAWGPRAGGVLLASMLVTMLVLLRQVVATRDIVRLHRLHAQRETERAGEARFRSLVQHSSDIIVVVDAAATVVYASPAVERVLGVSTSAVRGAPLAAFVHPDDAPRAVERLTDALATEAGGTSGPSQFRVRAADGDWRDVECLATNLCHDPHVGGVVITVRDVTERARLQAQLVHQAYHDPLTGLANRTLFRDRVEHALAREGRRPGGVAVLFLDLDDFKTVNDSLGHREGDRLLGAIAERLLNATRGCDTVARLGGDEFAVLLENARSEDDAVIVAERVVQAVKAPVSLGGQRVAVGVSIGIAFARAEDGTEELLRNADVAMYKAKQRGKSTYEIFAPAMHAALMDRVELEADLHRAVEELACAELRVHYQPIVDLADGRVTGLEALCRWEHPRRGLVPPTEFIPVAEAMGLIVPLGRWVLREACVQAAGWQARRAGDDPLTITVNLSARQLRDASLVDDVRDALADSGLAPSSLVLEITESVIVQDDGAARGVLAALKALGVRLAIDDFGTGYSSLGYLQRFPVDILKIDKAFVDGVGRGGSRSALARTIVALGDSLALRCVAEGIEEDAQRDHLRALGCAYGQGYLFARPMPPAEIDTLLGELAPAP